MWLRRFHLSTMFTTELERRKGITIQSLHLNLQQSQEALRYFEEQGQHHQSHPRKERAIEEKLMKA